LGRHLIATLLVLAAGATPAVAAAPTRGPLWATVNVCGQGAVGIRASMPGEGRAGQMYARFTAQWLNPRTNAWERVEGVPTSPWMSAGSARQLAGQAGWTFLFDRPPAGTVFQVRGLAELELRRSGGAVRRNTLVTSGGLAGVDEGRPPGTSLATCSLR
jgi:hypothetical protein